MPLFYLDVYEMRAILRAQGRLMDDVCDSFERIIDNNFIMTADESAISVYEQFLDLTPDADMTIEERRKIVIANLYRSPHIGEPEINEIFSIFSEGRLTVGFSGGRIELVVDLKEGEYLNIPAFLKALKRQIPAHLSLSVIFEARVGLRILTKGRGYKYRVAPTGVPLTGTIPQRNTEGGLIPGDLAIGINARPFPYKSPETGTKPQRDTLAGIDRRDLSVETQAKGYPYISPATDTLDSGTTPNRATKAGIADAVLIEDTAAAGFPYVAPEAGTKPSRSTAFTDAPRDVQLETGTQKFPYRATLAGISKTGVEPAWATRAKLTNAGVQVDAAAKGFPYISSPTGEEKAGTTPARSSAAGTADQGLQVEAAAKGFPYTAPVSGDTETGTTPNRETGGGAESGAFYAVAEVECFRYTVTLCGTSYCKTKTRR